MKRLLAILVGLMLSTVVLAQTVTQSNKFADPKLAASAPMSGASGISHVGLALFVVLMLIIVLAWVMRKFKFGHHQKLAQLELIQGISLGARERVVIVHVDGRRLLLGVAPGQVSLLTELAVDPADTPDDSVLSESTTQMPSFKALLKRSMGMS